MTDRNSWHMSRIRAHQPLRERRLMAPVGEKKEVLAWNSRGRLMFGDETCVDCGYHVCNCVPHTPAIDWVERAARLCPTGEHLDKGSVVRLSDSLRLTLTDKRVPAEYVSTTVLLDDLERFVDADGILTAAWRDLVSRLSMRAAQRAQDMGHEFPVLPEYEHGHTFDRAGSAFQLKDAKDSAYRPVDFGGFSSVFLERYGAFIDPEYKFPVLPEMDHGRTDHDALRVRPEPNILPETAAIWKDTAPRAGASPKLDDIAKQLEATPDNTKTLHGVSADTLADRFMRVGSRDLCAKHLGNQAACDCNHSFFVGVDPGTHDQFVCLSAMPAPTPSRGVLVTSIVTGHELSQTYNRSVDPTVGTPYTSEPSAFNIVGFTTRDR